jgi:putative ribosome biogenesis GTPase RsgA
MSAKVGDRVVVEAERTTQAPRRGVIEEILRKEPARFRVHWDDGHESILTPAAGSLQVEPRRRTGTAKG